MSNVLYGLTTAAMMIMMLRAAAMVIDVKAAVRRRVFPWAALVLVGLALLGLVVQLSWSGAMGMFDNDPARSGWWRDLTSVFLQNGGPAGDVWNLATLALVAVAAGILWGSPLTLVLFLAGVLLPGWLEALVGATSASHDPRNFVGSSGATYFLAATVTALVLVRATSWGQRVLALSVPVLGLISFVALDNAHGLVTVEGFVLGFVVALVVRLVKRPTRRDEPARGDAAQVR